MTQEDHPHCWEVRGVEGDLSCEHLSSLDHCRHCDIYQNAARQLFSHEGSSAYQEELAQKLSDEPTQDHQQRIRVLPFRLQQIWLAFSASIFVRVAPLTKVHPIPWRNSEVLRGLVNMGGELLLCMDLGATLGFDVLSNDFFSSTARLLTVQQQGKQWVFPVDEVGEIEEISAVATAIPSGLDLPGVLANLARGQANEIRKYSTDVIWLDEERLFALLNTLIHA